MARSPQTSVPRRSRLVPILLVLAGVALTVLIISFADPPMPAQIDAPSARAAQCPHWAPARADPRVRLTDYVFIARALGYPGSCRDFALDWLMGAGRSALYCAPGFAFFFAAAAWRRHRRFALRSVLFGTVSGFALFAYAL